MKPLEEYMLFTKTGAENITVINSQGVRSCQCSMEFDVTEKNVHEPSLNYTLVLEFKKSDKSSRIREWHCSKFNAGKLTQSICSCTIIYSAPRRLTVYQHMYARFGAHATRTRHSAFIQSRVVFAEHRIHSVAPSPPVCLNFIQAHNFKEMAIFCAYLWSTCVHQFARVASVHA